MRWWRRLAAGIVILVLAAAPALAQTPSLPSGTYLLEFFVLDDDCGHDPFINELPESITIAVGDDGSLTLTGPEPWVEVAATVDADGSIAGAGLGTVAGFPDVSVQLEGEMVEPGVLQGELAFGVGGELPGECPIIWQLTLVSESPVPTTTTSSTTSSTTTTTTIAERVEDTTAVVATTPTITVAPTTTIVTVLGGETSFPWIILILIGVVLLVGGSFWLWVLRTPYGYGPGMVVLLGGLSTTPQPEDPTDTETDSTTETTSTTTTADETTTEERDDTTTTADETTTEERDDTTTTADETTTEERDDTTTTADETTTDERDDTTTTADETTTEEREDTTTTDGGTRDGTTVFGPRSRPRDDCKELVDECERLREVANQLEDEARRHRERADRAKTRCDDATAAVERARKYHDEMEQRTDAPKYYERMHWAGRDLRDAQDRMRQACDAVEQAEADAAAAQAEAEQAQAAADEACARAKECLDNPPGSTPSDSQTPGSETPGSETPDAPGTPGTTDPAGSATGESARVFATRCGPETGTRFVACMDRIRVRLVVLFGRDTWRATGYLFLAANGGAMDYWILSEYLAPPCNCPSTRCRETVTLFGICYPHHVMSDFMYGFIAAWFGLSDSEIDAGSAVWKAWKYAGEGFDGPFAAPEWETVSKPAYAGGAAAAREILPNRSLGVRERHITDGLAGVTKREDCEPCPCPSVAEPDRDFSRAPWTWDEPIEIMSRWAVTGEDQPE